MKGKGAYADPTVNPYLASQMQNMAAQRMQHSAVANIFPGRPESFSPEEDHPCKSSKVEGKWKWERDAPKVPNEMSFHALDQSQVGSGTRSYCHGQPVDSSENQANIQPQEQDMEIGYEDNPSPQTFEGLEKKFLDEIMNLVKEQSDSEDAENSRHREKIVEINTRYQEKLSTLRAQHSTLREEFLRKESQTRLHQYQQAGISHYPSTGLQSARGYSGTAVVASAGEPNRAYTTGQFEPYRDRPQFIGGGRTQGAERRVPYPEGRIYNNSARYY